MGTLHLTVIGQDIFKIVEEKLELANINTATQVNNGMLGNLKTLTYLFDIDDIDIIAARTKLMSLMSEDNMRLMPMFVNGDWNRLFVMKPFRSYIFSSRSEQLS